MELHPRGRLYIRYARDKRAHCFRRLHNAVSGHVRAQDGRLSVAVGGPMTSRDIARNEACGRDSNDRVKAVQPSPTLPPSRHRVRSIVAGTADAVRTIPDVRLNWYILKKLAGRRGHTGRRYRYQLVKAHRKFPRHLSALKLINSKRKFSSNIPCVKHPARSKAANGSKSTFFPCCKGAAEWR